MNRILLLAFFLITTITCNAQNDEVNTGHYKTSTALSAGPAFYNHQSGILIGLQEELYRDEHKLSFIISFDYRTVRSRPYYDQSGDLGSKRNHNFLIRPGIRYFYSKKNKGVFNGLSLLIASEREGGELTIFGTGAGLSIGYRYLFKNQLFLEAEGFAGVVKARYPSDTLYPTGIHYYAVADLRIGYRF